MIRQYQSNDCAEVLNVWSRASVLAHPFLSEEFLASERYNIPNVYLPNADTWVWQVDGQVVGFISLLDNEIGALFVDPKHQYSGIGRALVQLAQDLRGTLDVEVFEKNLPGRAFYTQMGFEFKQKKPHEQTGFQLLRLQLAVNQLQQPSE